MLAEIVRNKHMSFSGKSFHTFSNVKEVRNPSPEIN